VSEDVTREIPQAHTLTDEATLAGELAPPGPPPLPEEDDEWPTRGPARGIRLAVPVAGLIAVLLVAGGFWGGAAVEKSHMGSSAASAGGAGAGLASRFRAAFANGGAGTTGAGGGASFGGSGAAATGTISVVDGKTLYVSGPGGSLTKVTLGPSTTITRNAKTSPTGLRPGDTVVVEGSTAKNGTITATSVTATQAGVSPTNGFGARFGGGFGGGGGNGRNGGATGFGGGSSSGGNGGATGFGG